MFYRKTFSESGTVYSLETISVFLSVDAYFTQDLSHSETLIPLFVWRWYAAGWAVPRLTKLSRSCSASCGCRGSASRAAQATPTDKMAGGSVNSWRSEGLGQQRRTHKQSSERRKQKFRLIWTFFWRFLPPPWSRFLFGPTVLIRIFGVTRSEEPSTWIWEQINSPKTQPW